MEQESLHPTVFDTEDQQVATLYGKALLGAAGSKVELIVSELESIVKDGFNRFPKLETAFASPRISEEEKDALIDRIFKGKVDKVLLNFMKVLARRASPGFTAGYPSRRVEMRDEQLGRLRVKVSSAQPLTDAQKKDIVANLKSKFGKEVVLIEKVDAQLLGGIVLRIGDRVYDGSVQGKLQTLRRAVAGGVEKAIRDKYSTLLS